MVDRAQNNYDRLSRWYDCISGRRERCCASAGVHRLGIEAGEKVLEIGTGTGHAIVQLARSVGGDGYVHGVDISSGMLRMVRKRIQKAKLTPRVSLYLGDAEQLPFENGQFDAVFMSFTLELFSETKMVQVLKECQRVLRRNGRMVVVSMSNEGKHRWLYRLYQWAHSRYPHTFDCRPIPVQTILRNAEFQIREAEMSCLWSLPVETVLARRK